MPSMGRARTIVWLSSATWIRGGLLLVAAGSLECFTGLATEGLACERDSDCGPQLSCDPTTKCCGGACGYGSSTTKTGIDTSTSTNESSTSEAICGNDVVEDGEDCDPGTIGVASETCNADCSFSICGDDIFNELDPGEECDDTTAAEPPFTTCDSDSCRAPLFFDPMETLTTAQWSTSIPFTAAGAQPSAVGWRLDSGRWRSGATPSCQMNQVNCAAAVQLQLSRCIVVKPSDGALIVELEHASNFNTSSNQDGGVVELELYEACGAPIKGQVAELPSALPSVVRQLIPDDDGIVNTPSCDCIDESASEPICSTEGDCVCLDGDGEPTCGACSAIGEYPNPLANRPLITDTGAVLRSTFEVQDEMLELADGTRAGGIGLRFTATFDCRQAPADDAWNLHQVAVWRLAARTGP